MKKKETQRWEFIYLFAFLFWSSKQIVEISFFCFFFFLLIVLNVYFNLSNSKTVIILNVSGLFRLEIKTNFHTFRTLIKKKECVALTAWHNRIPETHSLTDVSYLVILPYWHFSFYLFEFVFFFLLLFLFYCSFFFIYLLDFYFFICFLFYAPTGHWFGLDWIRLVWSVVVLL